MHNDVWMLYAVCAIISSCLSGVVARVTAKNAEGGSFDLSLLYEIN